MKDDTISGVAATAPESGYNFAYLDEGAKRMIRRAILKLSLIHI